VQTPTPTAAAGQPAPPPRLIRADHLALALVARKARPAVRWAAMSNGAFTSSCSRRPPGGGYLMHEPPLLTPMQRGRMATLLDRVRAHGYAEVHRTWHTGMRVLEAEFRSFVMATPTATRA